MQASHVDYSNLGDTGTSESVSIQPLGAEAALPANLNRPPENLRSRTEIARETLNALLYYRDQGARYVLKTSQELRWGLDGAGRVNNAGALTITPLLSPRSNVKGVLGIGTTGVNRVAYTVGASAYATQGMNAIYVEHRDVTGTVSVLATISAGPVYRILVVFDSANSAHDATAVVAAVSGAIGTSPLNGKLTIVNDGVGGNAIDATSDELPISVRTHGVGTDGNATADLEEHTLASGALLTFTNANPLVEGDVIAIRYDYLIDTDGGMAGGRAESSVARGSDNVSANLFLCHEHPEWMPGCLPLCRVVNGRLLWIDGTYQDVNTSVVPGASVGTYFNVGAFGGVPTQISNGALDNGGDNILQDVLVAIDQRLAQLRATTWVVTDGTLSTGGDFNAVSGVASAVSASGNGGTIAVRRGAYTSGLPTMSVSQGSIAIVGETNDLTLTGRTRITISADTTLTGRVSLRDLAYTRSAAVVTTVSGELSLERVAWIAGALRAYGARCHITDSAMYAGAGVGAHAPAGFAIGAVDVYAANTTFAGPDPSASSPVVVLDENVDRAHFTRCSFTSSKASVAPLELPGGSERTDMLFDQCTFTATAGSATLLNTSLVDFQGTITFRNCLFQAAAFSVARFQHLTGTMRFENCVFEAQGSPNGLSTATQPVLIANPGAAGTLIMRDCTVRVTETDYTGLNRALVYIGCDESQTSLTGRIDIDGLRVVLAGASVTAPASTVVWITRDDPAPDLLSLQNLVVDTGAKTQPDTTNAVGLTAGPAYIIRAESASYATIAPRMALRNFTILNRNGPASSASATSDGGDLWMQACDLDGYAMRETASPNTNTFRRNDYPQIGVYGGVLRNVDSTLLRCSPNGYVVEVHTADGVRGELIDARLSALVANQRALAMDGGAFRRVRISYAASTMPNPPLFARTTLGRRNTMVDSHLLGEDNVACFYTTGSSENLHLARNYFQCALSAGGTLLLAGSTSGIRMYGNTFITNGASAGSCTPDPTTVVATATGAISNNIFLTAAPTLD